MPLLTSRLGRSAPCAPRPAIVLRYVGDGPDRGHDGDELAGTRAHFLGCQARRELSTIYARADLFCFHLQRDTLGKVVMEVASVRAACRFVTDSSGGPKDSCATTRRAWLPADRRNGSMVCAR